MLRIVSLFTKKKKSPHGSTSSLHARAHAHTQTANSLFCWWKIQAVHTLQCGVIPVTFCCCPCWIIGFGAPLAFKPTLISIQNDRELEHDTQLWTYTSQPTMRAHIFYSGLNRLSDYIWHQQTETRVSMVEKNADKGGNKEINRNTRRAGPWVRYDLWLRESRWIICGGVSQQDEPCSFVL